MSEKAGKIVAKRPVTLIPYSTWANRGKGEMAVWLARDASKARVAREPGALGQGRGHGLGAGGQSGPGERPVRAPRARTTPRATCTRWPKKGTAEWIEYAFDAPVRVSEASVYWFDDTGGGGCRVPASWRVLYKSGEEWPPVKAAGAYGVAKDAWNAVRFAPVRTTALRLEVQLQPDWSAGVHEWKIK